MMTRTLSRKRSLSLHMGTWRPKRCLVWTKLPGKRSKLVVHSKDCSLAMLATPKNLVFEELQAADGSGGRTGVEVSPHASPLPK